MYEDLRQRLQNATYTLADARSRISWGVANGHLTVEQANELTEIAADHAETSEPEVTIPELNARQEALECALLELAAMVAALASGEPIEPVTGEGAGA